VRFQFLLLFSDTGGQYRDSIGEKPVAIAGIAVMLITTFSLYFAAKGIVLFRLLQGIGWGMASASTATAVSYLVSKEWIGRGMGYYSLTTMIAISFSPIVSILLMNRYGFESVILTSVAMVAASGIILCTIPKKHVVRTTNLSIELSGVIEKNALFPSFLEFLMILPASGMISMLTMYARVIDYRQIWIFYVGFSVMGL
jgi:MFS family permease